LEQRTAAVITKRAGKYVFEQSIKINDICGIKRGSQPGEFLLSSGGGGFYEYQSKQAKLKPLSQSRISFDNRGIAL